MKQAHVFISGFVQSVGFRAFIKKNAGNLSLSGWVRNTSDGRVEAIFKGPKENTKKMIKICNKGPFLSEVENVEVIWEDSNENYIGFSVLR